MIGAYEVAMEAHLRDSAFQTPMTEVRYRHVSWLLQLANSPVIAGLIHRYLASRVDGRVEPSQRSALPCFP